MDLLLCVIYCKNNTKGNFDVKTFHSYLHSIERLGYILYYIKRSKEAKMYLFVKHLSANSCIFSNSMHPIIHINGQFNVVYP